MVHLAERTSVSKCPKSNSSCYEMVTPPRLRRLLYPPPRVPKIIILATFYLFRRLVQRGSGMADLCHRQLGKVPVKCVLPCLVLRISNLLLCGFKRVSKRKSPNFRGGPPKKGRHAHVLRVSVLLCGFEGNPQGRSHNFALGGPQRRHAHLVCGRVPRLGARPCDPVIQNPRTWRSLGPSGRDRGHEARSTS